MGRTVVFKIVEGNFQQGFRIILQISKDGESFPTEFLGQLSENADIPRYYEAWQSSYRQLPISRRLDAPKTQVINASEIIDQCREAAQALEKSLNAWLDSEVFRPLKEQLLEKLNRSEPIRVFIQTQDSLLRRLPWHLWNFFDRYEKAEVVLSTPTFDPTYNPQINSPQDQQRILAILGDSEGINIEADGKLLKNLPRCDVQFLVEPKRQQISQELWQQNWSILFFAGHSCTQEEQGIISINPEQSLALKELKKGLKKSIGRGLQLAIFNSCDGLGLAKDLEDLFIPQVIVMREPVPDFIAQQFLKYFLQAFCQGESLYLAVRTARERLQDDGLENEIPGVTWLPIICQNPAVKPLVWQNLQDDQHKFKKPLYIISTLILSFFTFGIINFFINNSLNIIDKFSNSFVSAKPLCQGKSCIGRDPISNNCTGDTMTLTTQNNDVSSQFVKVELRYSKQCQATWLKTIGQAIPRLDYLEDTEGKKYPDSPPVPHLHKEYYSNMAPGNIQIRACTQLQNNTPECTSFVNPSD